MPSLPENAPALIQHLNTLLNPHLPINLINIISDFTIGSVSVFEQNREKTLLLNHPQISESDKAQLRNTTDRFELEFMIDHLNMQLLQDKLDAISISKKFKLNLSELHLTRLPDILLETLKNKFPWIKKLHLNDNDISDFKILQIIQLPNIKTLILDFNPDFESKKQEIQDIFNKHNIILESSIPPPPPLLRQSGGESDDLNRQDRSYFRAHTSVTKSSGKP